MTLTPTQVDALLHPIAGARVKKNREGNSHLEAYDVRRRLTNIFGFGGWSGDVIREELLYEDITVEGEGDQAKRRVSVGYRVAYRLVIMGNSDDYATPLASYTEVAAGDATNFPWNKRADAHDFAVKTAESQALKRCAINLGDQFGLSLYNKGSLAPLIVYVLGTDPAKWTPEGVVRPKQQAHDDPTEGEVDVTDHVTEPLAPETPAPEGGARPPVETPPPVQAPDSPPDRSPGPGEEPMPLVQDMLRDEVDAIINQPDATKQQKKAQLAKLLVRVHGSGAKGAPVSTGRGVVSLEAYVQAAVAGVK